MSITTERWQRQRIAVVYHWYRRTLCIIFNEFGMKKIILVAALILLSFPLCAQVGGVRFEEDWREIRLTVWTNSNAYGPAKVYSGGKYKGTITEFYSSTPSVGSYGCVTFTYMATHGASGLQSEVIRVESDNGYIWHVDPRIEMSDSNSGTLRVYCRGEIDSRYSSSQNSSTWDDYDSRSGTSSYDGGNYVPDFSDSGLGTMLLVSTSLLGIGLYIAGARSVWDVDTHRLDIGLGVGTKYGSPLVGGSVTYRFPKVIGFTGGFGFRKQADGQTLLGGFAGAQIWMFNGWNIEGGIHFLNITSPGWYVMSCTEFNFFRGVGFQGGLGYGRSFNSSSGYLIIDIGLVFRLFARSVSYATRY